jgi:hypothetical protein
MKLARLLLACCLGLLGATQLLEPVLLLLLLFPGAIRPLVETSLQDEGAKRSSNKWTVSGEMGQFLQHFSGPARIATKNNTPIQTQMWGSSACALRKFPDT